MATRDVSFLSRRLLWMVLVFGTVLEHSDPAGSAVKRSYIVMVIRGVFKKRPNFLNSAPTSTESALRLLGAPSVRF